MPYDVRMRSEVNVAFSGRGGAMNSNIIKGKGQMVSGSFGAFFDTYIQLQEVARWSKLREIEEIDIKRIYRILSTPDLELFSYPIERGWFCLH